MINILNLAICLSFAILMGGLMYFVGVYIFPVEEIIRGNLAIITGLIVGIILAKGLKNGRN